MLTLYTSYDLNTLSYQANHNFNKNITNDMSSSTIIVPSRGIGHWLTLQIAKYQGIAMRLDLQLTSSFMWNIAKKVLGNLPEQSFFSKKSLTWQIYYWLSFPVNLDKTPELKHYLMNANPCKTWILAGKIADTFDQYLLYRDDFLKTWEKGKLIGNLGNDEYWQALLWREITNSNKQHRAYIFDELLTKLQSNCVNNLPTHISVFAPSNMPMQQLAILQAVSRHIDVDIYALSPCAKYWGDIKPKAEFYTKELNINEDWYWEIGHPLLASLGKCGRDFFDHLAYITADFGARHIDLDENNLILDNSLLNALQSDIINLQLRLPNQRIAFQENDKSIQIHIAHSELREIEILHDNLLKSFMNDPTLQPCDVAVLTPDIEKYAPFIDAVFGASEHNIPYSLSDLSLRTTHPLLLAFCDLILLPKSRFIAEDILSLLQHKEIADKAQILPNELVLIRTWLNEAGARWALDGEHKTNFDLPKDDSYSLRISCERLLLGFASDLVFSDENVPLIEKIMPLNLVEGSNVQIMAKFMVFIDKLANWVQILQQNTNIANWQNRLLALLNDVISDNEFAAGKVNLIRDVILQIKSNDLLENFELDLSYDLVHLLVKNELERGNSEISFVRGKVTFGTMIPLRSIAFRMICVLGLNDGSLPRQNHVPSFDLINKYPRQGDRNRRFEDRYLFLETLMCARDILYLSYVGRDIKTGDLIAPSVVLNELLDACNITAQTNDGQKVSDKITKVHSLQPFSAINFAPEDPQSFATMWYEASIALNGNRMQLPAFYITNKELTEINYAKQITPDELIRILVNPIKFYLRKVLGINIDKHEILLPSNEPFMEITNEYNLNELLLKTANLKWNEDMQNQLASACNYLPSGLVGQIMWHNRLAEIKYLADKLASFNQENYQILNADITIKDIHICGKLPKICAKNYVNHQFYPPNGFSLTIFWLNHLLLNTITPITSYLFTLEQNWQANPVDNSAEQLELWLDAYKQAHIKPLPLFTKISYEFAQNFSKNNKTSTKKAKSKNPLDKAFESWQANSNQWFNLAFKGENPINNEFEQLANNLYGSALNSIVMS